MAWFESHLGGGNVSTISIKNNYLIGYSNSAARQSPIDVNNYIEVSGDNTILHRNNNSNNCSVYVYLNTGDTCLFLSDSITNTDGNIYIHKSSDISVDPISMTRIISQYIYGKGYAFTADTDAYYIFSFWSNNTNDITISNPRCAVF